MMTLGKRRSTKGFFYVLDDLNASFFTGQSQSNFASKKCLDTYLGDVDESISCKEFIPSKPSTTKTFFNKFES